RERTSHSIFTPSAGRNLQRSDSLKKRTHASKQKSRNCSGSSPGSRKTSKMLVPDGERIAVACTRKLNGSNMRSQKRLRMHAERSRTKFIPNCGSMSSKPFRHVSRLNSNSLTHGKHLNPNATV